jgi:hypothetical protein
MTLHNARIGEGIGSALEDLLEGIPAATVKTGQAGEAEAVFEAVRQQDSPIAQAG